MKILTENEIMSVSGAAINANACQSAILGSAGVAAVAGGAIGIGFGGFGGAIGAALGALGGGAYTIANNPVCNGGIGFKRLQM